MRALLAVLVLAVGCGASPMPQPLADAAPPEPTPVRSPAGVIAREELDRVLEAGPGAFLGRVEIEPVMEGDRFVAFQIAGLHDEALFGGVDLGVGDRLISINGQIIERPEHAMTVWSSLRVASELLVVIERAGELRQLRFAIVDNP
jgi:type II secretory pathway component PulC